MKFHLFGETEIFLSKSVTETDEIVYWNRYNFANIDETLN